MARRTVVHVAYPLRTSTIEVIVHNLSGFVIVPLRFLVRLSCESLHGTGPRSGTVIEMSSLRDAERLARDL